MPIAPHTIAFTFLFDLFITKRASGFIVNQEFSNSPMTFFVNSLKLLSLCFGLFDQSRARVLYVVRNMKGLRIYQNI